MMQTFDLTYENLAVERLEDKHVPDMIQALVARAEWASDPVLMARLVPDNGGTLLVRVGPQRTVASLITGFNDLFIGFDHDEQGAWPTVIAVSGLDEDPTAGADSAAAARALLGNSLRVAAREAAIVPGDWAPIPLNRAEGDALRAIWDGLDVHPLVTDDILEQTIASWSTDLVPVHRDAGAQGGDEGDVPMTVRTVAFSTAIADEGVFEGIVGRQRKRTEPYLVTETLLDPRVSGIQLTAAIEMPVGAEPAGIVSVDVTLGGRTWNIILEREPSQPSKLFGSRLLPADVPQEILRGNPGIHLTVHISR